MNKELYFFIGTEAELIKLAPVINKLRDKMVPFKLISSGQNDLSKSKLLAACNGGHIDILLSDGNIKKTPLGLLEWWIKTYLSGKRILNDELSNKAGSLMIVHGDTISTYMGALLANKFRLRVAHIEAGLRSFHLLSPFPEEIDRVLTSRYTYLHFPPNEWALGNLKKLNGVKVNTFNNTLIEALEYSSQFKTGDEIFSSLPKEFFVFAMHRQENLLNTKLFKDTIEKIVNISKKMPCVFIAHEPTLEKLKSVGLMSEITKNKNIILQNRLQYFDFMELLKRSQFVISDGGSNQEELYYLDKPALIIRNRTERIEGLGENVLLYKGNLDLIDSFIKDYKSYKKKTTTPKTLPSEIIVKELVRFINES